MSTKWTVPRDWEGETVAVLASGPSMSAAVAAYVRDRCRVIAVNNQGLTIAPWADVLYGADLKWWEHYRNEALKFEKLKVTLRDGFDSKEVFYLEYSTIIPFDPKPTHLVSGGNSGYQAVHLAAHFGAKRILMCGFDMREVNGERHNHGDHPGRLNTALNFRKWIHNFNCLYPDLHKRGIELVNCTPNSALKSVPYVPLQEAV